MAKAYPQAAETLAIDGHAVIACEVSAGGEAVDCRVLSEAPEGLGFGNAALTVSREFRFRPKTINGQPVGGGKARVPLTFRYPAEDDVAAGKGYRPPPSTDRQRALAGQLFDQVGGKPVIDEHLRRMMIDALAGAKAKITPDKDSAVTQEAVADAEAAVLARVPQMTELFLNEFAALSSEQDLESALSDRAKAKALVGAFAKRLDRKQGRLFVLWSLAMARDDARATFCSHRAC